MPEQFLYQALDAVSSMGFLQKEIPESVKLNLNQKFELRKYQVEAFSRFFHCYANEYPAKSLPLHLLFNMATGSGKTLIMAGLILYLYKQGYRNFLFFVNSINIIEKTKDNFLNPASSKFLFTQDISIDNKRVQISPVSNFEGINSNDISICFTTIQKLHLDLTTEKENSLTFEDFRKHKIVLISDESHHMNAKTKAENELFESWENTVQRIFEQNQENILLEFTATHDYTDTAMIEKYRHKVIYRYDLPEFRNDGFSKDVTLVYSDFNLEDRILQALILSQYKQLVAAKHRINLKPVILFKAQRTIAQSKENKENFHQLITHLTKTQISNIRKSTNPIIKRAFRFFDENQISDSALVEILKREFREEFCLSVNEDSELFDYQVLVNTLEESNNRIRAIFAVQKLNEGWDVLNLFDIVRCYETRDSGKGVVGKTTMAEAQLIGRGARYFPFVLPQQQDKFRRKFDNDLDNELRVIEELHYHSINDDRYISEIHRALVQQGVADENEITREMKLKESFKKEKLFKEGVIYTNRQEKKSYQYVHSFQDLGVTKKNILHTIAAGRGGSRTMLADTPQGFVVTEEYSIDIPVKEIERNIIQSAIARNPFFTFQSIKRYFPHLESISELIDSEDYLAGLEITFKGYLYKLNDNKFEKLQAMLELLDEIETQIRNFNSQFSFEGSPDFYPSFINQVFKDKKMKFSIETEKGKDDNEIKNFIENKKWYAFDSLYGTSEEKAFIRMLGRQIETKYKNQFDDIFLIRNEGHFSIFNFADGQAFQPDFVLFMTDKDGKNFTYQVFIEPKGKFLSEHDQWKSEFLKEIKKRFGDRILRLNYRLIGVPFYENEDENAFRSTLDNAIQ